MESWWRQTTSVRSKVIQHANRPLTDPTSVLWIARTIQGCSTSASRWSEHRDRCRRGHVRFPIHSIHPWRTRGRRVHRRRWAWSWTCWNTRISLPGHVCPSIKDEPPLEFAHSWWGERREEVSACPSSLCYSRNVDSFRTSISSVQPILRQLWPLGMALTSPNLFCDLP